MSKKKSWLARLKDFLFPLKEDTKEKLKNKKKRSKKKMPIVLKSTTNNSYSLEATSLPKAGPSSSKEVGSSTHFSTSLPTSCSSTRQCEEYSPTSILLRRAQLVQHVEKLAAIKIQTAFRAYLARKALRALRGLVRLQAMMRGRAVRRQSIATLKSLQSIVSIQSQVCATRYQKANEYKQIEDPRDVKLKTMLRRQDHTLLMADQDDAILLGKTEAMMRRNRLKAYSFNHRHSSDTEDARIVGRLRQSVEEREENEVPMKEEIKRVDTIRLRNKQPMMLAPRSSFESKKLRSTSYLRDKLEAKPTYMAATESARARARHIESYSDGDSPYKNKFAPTLESLNSRRSCGGGGSCTRQSLYLVPPTTITLPRPQKESSSSGFTRIGGSTRFNRNVGDYGGENGRWLLNWNE